MNRRHILSLSAIAALGLAMLPGNAVAQTKSLKDQLVGTWMAASWEQDVPNGPKFQRYGANPKGVTVFDANGRFFSMTARPDLPKIASGNPSTPTPEEAKAITLHYEASSFANQLASDQKRVITSLTADELKFQNPTAISGGQIYYGFKRAK